MAAKPDRLKMKIQGEIDSKNPPIIDQNSLVIKSLIIKQKIKTVKAPKIAAGILIEESVCPTNF